MNLIVTTSWDDGHVLDLRLAHRLHAHGVRGTFYVAPMSLEINKASRLSEHQLRHLAGGFEIGGHTLRHVRLPSVPLKAANEEIRSGKQWLEDVLQTPLRSFCYPGGEYRPEHRDLVQQAGFAVARTIRRWESSSPRDLLELGTTVHAYRHLKDVATIGRRSLQPPLHAIARFWNWDVLAMQLFDEVARDGGVFHLWGHSWEINAHHDWTRLERVLEHISGRRGVEYLTNGELACHARDAPFVPRITEKFRR